MNIVYIAHPIRGDVPGNIYRVERIVQYVMTTDPVNWPIAPYLDSCRFLDDENPRHRQRAFDVNLRFFASLLVNELWVCGRVSEGVQQEMNWAYGIGIPVNFKDFSWL